MIFFFAILFVYKQIHWVPRGGVGASDSGVVNIPKWLGLSVGPQYPGWILSLPRSWVLAFGMWWWCWRCCPAVAAVTVAGWSQPWHPPSLCQAGHREMVGLGHQVMLQQWLEHIVKDSGELRTERNTGTHGAYRTPKWFGSSQSTTILEDSRIGWWVWAQAFQAPVWYAW